MITEISLLRKTGLDSFLFFFSFLLKDISVFEGCLMPKPSLKKNNSDVI